MKYTHQEKALSISEMVTSLQLINVCMINEVQNDANNKQNVLTNTLRRYGIGSHAPYRWACSSSSALICCAYTIDSETRPTAAGLTWTQKLSLIYGGITVQLLKYSQANALCFH